MTKVIVDLHICIQGEGRYSGVPNLLIRTTGCNLNCQFGDSICDTPYASWKPEAGKYDLDDVERMIKNNPQIKHAFITGGEPTIHPLLLVDICKLLHEYNYHVSIETNGTNDIVVSTNVFLTISPKLASSVPIIGSKIVSDYGIAEVVDYKRQLRQIENRQAYDNMESLISIYRNYQFKFVASGKFDIDEILRIQDRLQIPGNRIYLMPEGINNEQLQSRRAWVIDICIRYGYNYSDRLQIIAYGNKRLA